MAEARRESDRKGVANFRTGSEAGAEQELQFVTTINTTTRKIVRVEKVDKSGKRQELAEEDWAKVIGDREVESIESAMEEAFEARVAAVFGETFEEDQGIEDDEERELRQVLIDGLLHRPIRRRTLQRALVKRLLFRATSKAASANNPRNLSSKKGA